MIDLSEFFVDSEDEFMKSVGLDNSFFDANRFKFGIYVPEDITLWQYN